MKKGIHPEYKEFKIKVGDDELITKSTHPAGVLLMDIDFRQHPAWNKDKINVVNQGSKSVSDFNNKFEGLNFGF